MLYVEDAMTVLRTIITTPDRLSIGVIRTDNNGGEFCRFAADLVK